MAGGYTPIKGARISGDVDFQGFKAQRFVAMDCGNSPMNAAGNWNATPDDGAVGYRSTVGDKHLIWHDDALAESVDVVIPRIDAGNSEQVLRQWQFAYNPGGASSITVASTTRIDNLNAHYLADSGGTGRLADATAAVNTIALRDGNGRLLASAPSGTIDGELVTYGFMYSFVAGVRDPKQACLSVYGDGSGNTDLYADHPYTWNGGAQTITINAFTVFTFDGVTLAVNDRVGLIGETGAQAPYSGIYIVTQIANGVDAALTLQRAADANTDAEVTNGMQFWVTTGGEFGSSGWLLTTADPITLDTTALTFVQNNGTTGITAGNGIVKSGNTIHAIQSAAYTTNTVVYAGSTSTLALTAINATATNKFLRQVSSGVPSFEQVTVSDIGSPAALTRVSDTNVTLTLGGSPTTALLAATSLTLGWTGTLAVSRGGTGAGTLADGGLVIGNGTGAVEVVAAGLTTQILVGGGALTAPVWGTDLPTAVTIGTAYIYRVGGTDVAVTDGGTGVSAWTQYGIIYPATTTSLTQVAVNATATNKFLRQVSGGAPSFEQVALGDLSGAQDLSVSANLNISAGTGTGAVLQALTLDTVQGIQTSSTPTFQALTLNNLTANGVVYASGAKQLQSGSDLVWDTDLLTIARDSIGETQSDSYGVAIRNTTAATALLQQYSPPLRFEGQGWKTNVTAASQSVEFRLSMVTVTGAAAPTGYMLWEKSVNGAGYATCMTISSAGGVSVGATLEMPQGILNVNAGYRIQNAAGSGKVLRGDGTNYIGSTFTIPDTFAQYDIIYASAANTLTAITTAASSMLVTDGSGIPGWGTDLPTGVTIGGAYIYRVGGTDVAVGDGGTGVSSWTLNGVVYASGTTTLTNSSAFTWDGSTLSVDGDLSFVGPQSISTTAGALTLAPATWTRTGKLITDVDGTGTDPGLGDLQVRGNSGGINRPRIGLKDDAGTGEWLIQPWSSSGDGYLSIVRNAGTGHLVIPSGNVGIGTTVPDGTLHVHTATSGIVDAVGGADELILENNTNAGLSILTPNTASGRIVFGDPNDNDIGRIVYDHNDSSGSMAFHTNGDTVAMKILNSGNVGIGTTGPVSLTEIQGGLTTTGAVLTLGSKETTTVANDVLGRINFYAPLDAAGTDANLVAGSIVARAEGTFSASSNATSLLFQTGASEVATTKMTISSAGVITLGGAAYAVSSGIVQTDGSGVLSSSTDLPGATTIGGDSVSRIHTETIGDGVLTSFNIDHNFALANQATAMVQVVYNESPWDTAEMLYVTRPTVNRVTVEFIGGLVPTLNQFMVIVTAPSE